MSLRPTKLTLGVVLPAAAFTAVLALWAGDTATFRPTLRVAVETGAALIALLAAYLVSGRLRRAVHAEDLVLVGGLYVLALSNFLFGALPAILEIGEDDEAAWAVTLGQTVGATALAAAALLPVLRVGGALRRIPPRATVSAAVALVITVIAVAVPLLPDALRLADGRGYEVTGPLAAVHLVAGAAYLAACVGFVRRAERRNDELLAWLAAGVGLAAVARLCYVVFPAPAAGWVQPGDALRVLFYFAMFVGAVQEIRRYWHGLADKAVLEERRRIARDLHDGVAQELAYIARRARRLGASNGKDMAPIAASAERALDDSRRAIAALTRPVDEALDVVLAEATEEVAARFGKDVELELAEGVVVKPEVREALVRIACEAVGNAARHGDGSVIRVDLEAAPRMVLRVRDDGRGFDPARVQPTSRSGFGLTTMRERAAALGATFRLRSQPGDGTEIEVTLP